MIRRYQEVGAEDHPRSFLSGGRTHHRAPCARSSFGTKRRKPGVGRGRKCRHLHVGLPLMLTGSRSTPRN
jgi:hypothetical protein